MRHLLPITICFALGGHAADAATTECPVAPGGGDGAAANARCGEGGGGGGGGGPVCPVAIPTLVDAFAAQCFTIGRSPNVRCGSPLAQTTCTALTQSAFTSGRLTMDGALWLEGAGYCPIFVDSIPQILDFCPSAGGARACPVAIPRPADAFDTQCKTAGKPVTQRCAMAIPADTCATLIQTAVASQLLTSDAAALLRSNGFCPVVTGGSILDFCPVGCFAAETRILTATSDGGEARYAAVAQLVPGDPVLALSDAAGLDAVDLVSRRVARVVYGPEEPPLFAFALTSGATLRVTAHHPMVLDTGAIIEAADVQPGAAFLGVDGQAVTVTAITREPATADVFNLRTDGDTQISHVIGAETVLVGDLQLQNDLAAEQGAIELRR